MLAEDEYGLEPEVSFPFGGADEDAGLDYRPPGHPALAFSTSRGGGDEEVLVREVPPMNSFMGAEPGTVGWEYFLMLPVGDAEREQEGFDDDDLDEGGRERGGGLRETRGGVRSVELGYIVQRLRELGNTWQAKKRRRRRAAEQSDWQTEDEGGEEEEKEERNDVPKSVDMYTHLFTHLLFPPTRITTEEYHDPYSLKVQIMALMQTLANKVWLDFSSVRWRIKLGQILWGNAGLGEDGEPYEEWEASAKESERVWLLLQILLAAELLVRLEMVLEEAEDQDTRRDSAQSNHSVPESKESILKRIREAGGIKVQWDILLARRWLENIRIVEQDAKSPSIEKESERTSFLSPPSRWFTSRQPSPEPSAPPTPDVQNVTDAQLLPRHPKRQVDGLVHFARMIQWPNVDSLGHRKAPTPTSSIYHGGSHFGSGPRPKRLRDIASDTPTLHRQKSAILTVPSMEGCGGWLSRSYLTGLILPGEGLAHLVVSTLLENDPAAVEVLGFNTNLYGGFQYMGKTWWSRYCIVGRVMAGFEGAGEECGWIGPVMGSGVIAKDGKTPIHVGTIPDGWVDVITLLPLDGKTHRALEPDLLRTDGDVRGRSWSEGTELRRDTFAPVPTNKADQDLEIDVRGVFFNPVDMEEDADFLSYEAGVHFLVGPSKKVVLEMKYDVSFVAAWPCSPSYAKGHLLHNSFVYTSTRIEELHPVSAARVNEPVALVETWTAEQRVYAYSWASHKGRSVLVATRGKTCGACAIREAYALALGAVVFV